MTVYVLDLPVQDFPNYSYTTDLDGKKYKLHFIYQVNRKSWYLFIEDNTGKVLLAGVRLVPWLDLLRNYSKEELPLGNLYLLPVSSDYPKAPEITLQNLSSDFELVYNSVT